MRSPALLVSQDRQKWIISTKELGWSATTRMVLQHFRIEGPVTCCDLSMPEILTTAPLASAAGADGLIVDYEGPDVLLLGSLLFSEHVTVLGADATQGTIKLVPPSRPETSVGFSTPHALILLGDPALSGYACDSELPAGPLVVICRSEWKPRGFVEGRCFSPAQMDFLTELEKGRTISDAAAFSGVSRHVLYRARETNPAFALVWDKTLAVAAKSSLST